MFDLGLFNTGRAAREVRLGEDRVGDCTGTEGLCEDKDEEEFPENKDGIPKELDDDVEDRKGRGEDIFLTSNS